jgi:hypothetical protein
MSRKSEARRCTPPPNPTGTNRTSLMLPARARRFEELFLLWSFAYSLRVLLWADELKPLEAIEWGIDLARPLMSRREREQLARELSKALEDPRSDPQTWGGALSRAGARWFCSLRLPRSEERLWGGSPLWSRRRASPLTIGFEPGETRAVYGFVVECLAGIAATGGAVGTGGADLTEDMRQILVDLEGTGSGRVIIQIDRLDDARRTFAGLSDYATSVPGDRTDTAGSICRRIVREIDRAADPN